ADQVADLRRPLAEVSRDEGGARPVRALDHALDIDAVAGIGAEQLAGDAGAFDGPGDEGGRPRHLAVEAAEVGPVDALPVVVDALRFLAPLGAELLGARRLR